MVALSSRSTAGKQIVPVDTTTKVCICVMDTAAAMGALYPEKLLVSQIPHLCSGASTAATTAAQRHANMGRGCTAYSSERPCTVRRART